MKKINIIKDNQEFSRIINNIKPFRTTDYVIYKENIKTDNYKFGITISKKICNAVGRNKIKRQIKNIIDKNHYQNNFNCIIIVRRGVLNKTFQEMNNELNECFKKINILKGENNEKKFN